MLALNWWAKKSGLKLFSHPLLTQSPLSWFTIPEDNQKEKCSLKSFLILSQSSVFLRRRDVTTLGCFVTCNIVGRLRRCSLGLRWLSDDNHPEHFPACIVTLHLQLSRDQTPDHIIIIISNVTSDVTRCSVSMSTSLGSSLRQHPHHGQCHLPQRLSNYSSGSAVISGAFSDQRKH